MTESLVRKYEGMIAETVLFQGCHDDAIGGYCARPIGGGLYPGVIVIHEAFGLVTHTKELVRKFAADGYIALAPDLYWREGTVDPVDTRAVVQRMGGVPDIRAIGDLEGAATFLKNHPTCSGTLGSIGHCSGGRHSLLFACNSSSLRAAIDCYGGRVVTDELTPAMPKAVVDMIPDLDCPVLGLFGASDGNPTPDQVERLESELIKHKKRHEFINYPEPVGHAFFADYRPSYNQEAATDGWMRIQAFFEEHLKNYAKN